MKPILWTTSEMLSLKKGILPDTKPRNVSIAKLNGLKRPARKMFHEHFDFQGSNWSWKDGSWICTSSKVRRTDEYNLTKVLWKIYHGIYPDANHDVRYRDGNRFNLKKSNLVLLTKREAQLLRLKDPIVNATNYAQLAFGRLVNAILEIQDPDKKKLRFKKAAETNKRIHPDRIKKAVETRRKRAESRGYYYTEEQRKKMSESHKGKPNPNKGKKWQNRKTSRLRENGGQQEGESPSPMSRSRLRDGRT